MDLAALADAGFDIVHAFDPARTGIAMFVDGERPRGWLVGNTRALWPRFVAARRADADLDGAEHPLERYTEAAIARALSGGHGRSWFGHRTYEEGTFIPLQAVAVASGLGTLAPTGLVIHPVYGPWFALRAVIVEPGEPPQAREAITRPCLCGAPCLDALARAQSARGPDAWRAWLAVRDACPVGHEHRYSDEQILYHYGRNRDRLG